MVHFVGCSHVSLPSPQNLLKVIDGSNPKISRSSWIRKEKVETEVPIKYLEFNLKIVEMKKGTLVTFICFHISKGKYQAGHWPYMTLLSSDLDILLPSYFRKFAVLILLRLYYPLKRIMIRQLICLLVKYTPFD